MAQKPKNQKTLYEIEQDKKSLVRDPKDELPPEEEMSDFLESINLPADPDPEE